MIQKQILQTNITRTVWERVRRITNEILGIKRLKAIQRMSVKKMYCAIHRLEIYPVDSITCPLNKSLSLYLSQFLQTELIPVSYYSMKGQGVSLLPSGWVPQHFVMLPQQFTSIHLYSWMERTQHLNPDLLT